MIFDEFKKVFDFESKKMNIILDDLKMERFYKYMNLLLEWNEKINLTAITDEREIIVKHFLDSLTIEKYLDNIKNLADIGTGAGFPGIPIKIFNPNIKITLVDSLNKRVNFLNDIVKELKLENVEVIHSRAEDLGKDKNCREKFDVVTSRAVANLRTLAEYLLPFVKKEGICICMKGPNVDNELEEAKNSINILGGKIEKIEKIFLKENDMERNILIIRKIQNTPNKYPRKAGIPTKSPL